MSFSTLSGEDVFVFNMAVLTFATAWSKQYLLDNLMYLD